MKGAIAIAVSYYIPVWLMFLSIPALFAYAIWETRDIEKRNK